MDFSIVLFIVLLRHQVGAVKLLHIHVPPYTLKGESALLQCRYDLGLDKLYSVTWYKDNEEFYRYVPRSNPSQHSHLVEGVKVDPHMSDSQQVYLRHVSLRSSGLYRCEVSAEAPSFTSAHGDAHMEIISLPQQDPKITCEEKVYASGDILALNCTSDKSFPPARLKWFINGVQVHPDYEAMIQQHGLVSSVSGLRLEVGPHHLSNGKINIRCEATVQSSRPVSKPLIDQREMHISVQGNAFLPRPCFILIIGFLTISQLILIP